MASSRTTGESCGQTSGSGNPTFRPCTTQLPAHTTLPLQPSLTGDLEARIGRKTARIRELTARRGVIRRIPGKVMDRSQLGRMRLEEVREEFEGGKNQAVTV